MTPGGRCRRGDMGSVHDLQKTLFMAEATIRCVDHTIPMSVAAKRFRGTAEEIESDHV